VDDEGEVWTTRDKRELDGGVHEQRRRLSQNGDESETVNFYVFQSKGHLKYIYGRISNVNKRRKSHTSCKILLNNAAINASEHSDCTISCQEHDTGTQGLGDA
jgi:hypothetical protein